MNTTNQGRNVVVFLLPWAVIYAAFFVFPFLFSFVLGFLSYNPLNVSNTEWAGASNFTRLLGDADFMQALRNTLLFVLGTVLLELCLVLLFVFCVVVVFVVVVVVVMK